MTDTLSDVQAECQQYGNHTPEYYERMMHRIPHTTVVDRVEYIVDQCRGKRVLDLGCAGKDSPVNLHAEIKSVASKCYGVDKEAGKGVDLVVDLDDLPVRMLDSFYGRFEDIDFVVCSEVLEHLSNPGYLLKDLHACHCPMIISVPNAFCNMGRRYVMMGTENVHIDHVAYYSYWTLLRLIERVGYTLEEWYWYGGHPRTAEGIIFKVR